MKAILMSIQPKWCELIANGGYRGNMWRSYD